jgi:hypothetical protein
MASHHSISVDTEQRYVITTKAQSRLVLALVIGLSLTVLGCVLAAFHIGEEHHASTGYSSFTSSPVKIGNSSHGDKHGADAHATEAQATTAHGGSHGEGSAHDAHVKAGHGSAEHAATEATAEHGGGHHEFHWYQRVFANLWLNGTFFMGLAVIGLFFVAVQYVSQAGWSAAIIRVPMSFGSFLPFALAVLVITFLVGSHDIFHWTHEGLYDKGSPEYDAILDGKKGYLNTPFFLVRMVGFVGLWIFFNHIIRKNSLKEDGMPGHGIWRSNHKNSAIFLVIFAVSSSVLAWDWLMSIEPHWYSTLFGWYTFASWHVSGFALLALTLVLLKEKGLLAHVNANHLHDVGKFMFGLSIFWTYLWISQYLLIWYANIPEEGIYFIERVRGFDGKYTALFFMNLIINFVFPFLFLMTRDAKRTIIFMKIAACAILIGHWLDFYLMIMPGTLGANAGFGLIEFGMVLTFAAGFIFVISRALASAPLVAKNHPMLEESLHHDI